MFENGISHLTAASNLQRTMQILEWLSYVREIKDSPLPTRPTTDSWDRDIGYTPSKDAYDFRWFIEDKIDETTHEYQSRFFDKGSFLSRSRSFHQL